MSKACRVDAIRACREAKHRPGTFEHACSRATGRGTSAVDRGPRAGGGGLRPGAAAYRPEDEMEVDRGGGDDTIASLMHWNATDLEAAWIFWFTRGEVPCGCCCNTYGFCVIITTSSSTLTGFPIRPPQAFQWHLESILGGSRSPGPKNQQLQSKAYAHY